MVLKELAVTFGNGCKEVLGIWVGRGLLEISGCSALNDFPSVEHENFVG